MKQCTKCKKWKDESEFSKQLSRKDGLRSWCKKCVSEYSHKYYRRNRKSVKKHYSYEECHRVVKGVKEKRCTKCKKWKDESEFSKQRTSKDGLRPWCKKCEREYTRKYYGIDGKPVKKYYRYEESHRVVNGTKEKRCPRCRKWKAESKYYKRHRSKDGLMGWCKECSDEATNKCHKRQLAVRN